MKDIILVACILILFALGFFLIKKLDKYLNETRASIDNENDIEQPSCIMLTNELSDEEIMQEIQDFKKSHKQIHIVVYDKDNFT